jgi:hypothetical protein
VVPWQAEVHCLVELSYVDKPPEIPPSVDPGPLKAVVPREVKWFAASRPVLWHCVHEAAFT